MYWVLMNPSLIDFSGLGFSFGSFSHVDPGNDTSTYAGSMLFSYVGKWLGFSSYVELNGFHSRYTEKWGRFGIAGSLRWKILSIGFSGQWDYNYSDVEPVEFSLPSYRVGLSFLRIGDDFFRLERLGFYALLSPELSWQGIYGFGGVLRIGGFYLKAFGDVRDDGSSVVSGSTGYVFSKSFGKDMGTIFGGPGIELGYSTLNVFSLKLFMTSFYRDPYDQGKLRRFSEISLEGFYKKEHNVLGALLRYDFSFDKFGYNSGYSSPVVKISVEDVIEKNTEEDGKAYEIHVRVRNYSHKHGAAVKIYPVFLKGLAGVEVEPLYRIVRVGTDSFEIVRFDLSIDKYSDEGTLKVAFRGKELNFDLNLIPDYLRLEIRHEPAQIPEVVLERGAENPSGRIEQKVGSEGHKQPEVSSERTEVSSELSPAEKSYSADAKETLEVLSDVDEIPSDLKGRFSDTNIVAVIIANGEYKDSSIPSMEWAYRDALSFKKHLVELLGVPESNIIYKYDVSKSQMEALVGSATSPRGMVYALAEKIMPDTLIFYYVGHGSTTSTGEPVLLPSDALSSSVDTTGVPVRQILRNLAKTKATLKWIILEACFSGITPEGVAGLTIQPKNPLDPNLKGIIYMAAADKTQYANYYPKEHHGLFTYYLLKAMQESIRENGRLSLSFIKDYVGKNVVRTAATELEGYRVQTPVIYLPEEFKKSAVSKSIKEQHPRRARRVRRKKPSLLRKLRRAFDLE